MLSTSLLTLSRPYAHAIFHFALEHQTLDKWELMLTCAKNLVENKKISRLLHSNIRPLDLSELLILIAKHDFDCFGQNFIRIMAEYKRLYLIPIIFDEFCILRCKYNTIIPVKIITVTSLSNYQMLKINFIFQQKLLWKIDITYELNPSIIGGIIIYINNIVIDGSIYRNIQRLKNILGIQEEKIYGVKSS